MHMNRSLLAVALAMASAAGNGIQKIAQTVPLRFGPRAKTAIKRVGFRRYAPHQSHRECARRRGGAAWIAFKRADRARRGLPVEG